MIVKKSLLVLLVFVLALVMAIPVFASPPDRVDFEDGGEFELVEDCSVYGEGWNFSVWNRWSQTGTDLTFYNNDGEVVRLQFNSQGIDNLFRLDEPDNVLASPWNTNGTWNLETDDIRIRGNFWNLQLPGVGNVFHFAGAEFIVNGEFDRFAGLETRDLEMICRYFAG